MKRPPFFRVTMLLMCLISYASVSQRTAPNPEATEFAGVKIKLNEEARRILQAEIQTISQNRTSLNAKLERASLFFPIIEGILSEESIPEDFKYLPLQESNLLANAVSTNRGLGFWQLRLQTANEGGLRIDQHMDERKNLNASTKAACLYLSKMNQQLNNWVACLQMYRTGTKDAPKIIPSNWKGNSEIIITANNSLYILKALALKTVIEKESVNFKKSGNVFFEYPYSGGKTLAKIATELGVSQEDISRYNSWLTMDALPNDKKYVLLIPANEQIIQSLREKALTANNKIAVKEEEVGFPVLKKLQGVKAKPYLYEINERKGVQALMGDDIESLANRADVSVRKLLKFNDLDKKDYIIPNEIYYIERKAKKAPVPFHTVKEGQNLWNIAQMYGIRLANLLKYNRLPKEQRLQTGRVMWMAKVRPDDTPIEILQYPTITEQKVIAMTNIQTKEASTKPIEMDMTVSADTKFSGIKMFENEEEAIKRIDPRKPFTHTVASGQSLYGIARQYGISLEELYVWNKLPEDGKIKSGQKILIKMAYQ